MDAERTQSSQESLIESYHIEKMEFENTLKKTITQERAKIEQELKTQLLSQNSHDDEMFAFKSEHEKQMALLEEKYTQQCDQLQLVRDRLKKKEEELNTSKTNYTNKLDSIKSKFNDELGHLKAELEDKSNKLTLFDKD